MIKSIIFKIGQLFSILTPVINTLQSCKMYLYSGYISRRFNTFGLYSVVRPYITNLVGAKYISIGKHVIIGKNVQLMATSFYQGHSFNPKIEIGDYSVIGDGSHITAINMILIGNNVLFGRNILISDNSHGLFKREELCVPPLERPLQSKGAVIIEDNVWIGEKVSIIGSVRIGKGSIIGANTVVTKDILPFSLVVGKSGDCIKLIDNDDVI